MSRIGKRPVPVPSNVTATVSGQVVKMKGPKGELSFTVPEEIKVAKADGGVELTPVEDTKLARGMWGMSRTMVANLVKGVTEGYATTLEIQGVGYRAEAQGRKLSLQVGFSHPVVMEVPQGLAVSVDRNVIIRIEGPDRGQVGQFAANVRAVRPPEPYKGKGIRYVDERVRRKVGKAAAGSAGG